MNEESTVSPILTVITTTWNLCKSGRAETFKMCVESVRQLEFADRVEHLIIDGASKDGTLELIREYEEQGAVKCISEPDTGIYNAMNKGLALAKGKYIAFLNSDDFWHEPKGVETAIRLLENTDAAFAYGGAKRVNPDDFDDFKVWKPAIGRFFARMPFSHQTMISRTDILRKYHGFDENFKIAADLDLVMRVMLGGEKPVYVPYVFASCLNGGISTVTESEDLHTEERYLIRRKLLEPIIGEEAVHNLEYGIIPNYLPIMLAAHVHPTVYVAVRDICYYETPGVMAVRTVRNMYSKKLPSLRITRKLYKLFHFLPVLSTENARQFWNIKLFTFIPLVTARRKGPVCRIKLFGIIPIFRCKTSTRFPK